MADIKIQATELRIGNLILDHLKKPREVAYLTDCIGLDIGDGATQKYQTDPIISGNIEDLKPIELTEEWLIKSEYAEEIKEWKGNGQDCQPETSKTKERRFYLIEGSYLVFTYFSYRANEKDKWITDRSISIEYYGDSIQLTNYYIHTLQNLFFALTAKELTIK